jgi:formylmethanofuran dehydrogenase subunit E
LTMSFDFKGLYDFHGHRCPMSTMGARLGLAAMAALGVTKADQFLVEGHYCSRNCALDGIQFTTGCTLGNGNFSFEDHGRASLVLRMRDGSRSVTVSISEPALTRLAEHKRRKAELLEEKAISGLPRAMEIDTEIAREFDALIAWVQDAGEDELLVVESGGGGC